MGPSKDNKRAIVARKLRKDKVVQIVTLIGDNSMYETGSYLSTCSFIFSLCRNIGMGRSKNNTSKSSESVGVDLFDNV